MLNALILLPLDVDAICLPVFLLYVCLFIFYITRMDCVAISMHFD